MPIEVTMPKFGLTMHEGTLQRYFKTAGEVVKAGEPIYEVETEKVLYEVESPASGILACWIHPEGDTVECGALVALIATAGEDAAAIASAAGASTAAPAVARRAPAQVASLGAAAASTTASSDTESDGRRAVSPVARKLAAELKVDLARVTGTGPGGRVTREDVERAARKQALSPVLAAPQSTPAAADAPAKPRLRSLPMRGMRKTIATRMHQSLRETAQLTITSEADVTAAVELRGRLTR
jgi:pyruvate dehydrogenase E2 component (dihydrolipoamide acetyltransferase)